MYSLGIYISVSNPRYSDKARLETSIWEMAVGTVYIYIFIEAIFIYNYMFRNWQALRE